MDLSIIVCVIIDIVLCPFELTTEHYMIIVHTLYILLLKFELNL